LKENFLSFARKFLTCHYCVGGTPAESMLLKLELELELESSKLSGPKSILSKVLESAFKKLPLGVDDEDRLPLEEGKLLMGDGGNGNGTSLIDGGDGKLPTGDSGEGKGTSLIDGGDGKLPTGDGEEGKGSLLV
jgi:hypothetical protein